VTEVDFKRVFFRPQLTEVGFKRIFLHAQVLGKLSNTFFLVPR